MPSHKFSATPVRHEKFYLEEDVIIFRVEDHLFRVHTHFFKKHSPKIWNTVQGYVLMEGEIHDPGTSDDLAMVLDDVKSEDFAALLSLFYNTGQIDHFLAPKETWLSILKLAHKWEMERIKDIAVERLSKRRAKFDAVEKIVVCDRFAIDRNWAFEAFKDICTRDESLSMEESTILGPEISVAVSSAREKIMRLTLRQLKGGKSPEDQEIKDIIRNSFSITVPVEMLHISIPDDLL